METKSRFLQGISALLLLSVVRDPLLVGAVTPDGDQPFGPPRPYAIEADIDKVTPTCIMLTWKLRSKHVELSNVSHITTVNQWRIELNVTSSNKEMETVAVDELIVAGSRSTITLGPFDLGASIQAGVHLHKFVTDDGQTLEGEALKLVLSLLNITAGINDIRLPYSDRSCSKSRGRRLNPCSECVCISSSFSGPNCEDPTFKPHSVSAWPLSNGSMHIEWTFDADRHRRSLDKANLRLSNISVSITEAATGSLVMKNYVPINYHSELYGYDVNQNLSPDVEYEVVVGVNAVGSSSKGSPTPSDLIVANSSARTFIPEWNYVATVADGSQALKLSTTAVVGVIVGVAVVSCLLASVTAAVIMAICMRVRSKGETRPTTYTRPPVPLRIPNPNSNLPLSPSQIPPRMEQNPAYGQLRASGSNTGSTDYPYYYENEHSDILAEGYQNTRGTQAKAPYSYTYITQ